MKCWYRTNISCKNVLRKDWSFTSNSNNNPYWYLNPKDVFEPDWIHLLESYDLPLKYVLLFYRTKNSTHDRMHVDVRELNPFSLHNYGLNFVIGGKNSRMIWYHTGGKEFRIMESGNVNGGGKGHAECSVGDSKEIDSVQIKDKLTLVKVDVPHRIENTEEERWCFSLRLDYKYEETSWDHIVGILNKHKLLEN